MFSTYFATLASTGARTIRSTLVAIPFALALAAAAHAQQSAVLYGGAADSLYTINAATGAATLVGPTGAIELDGLAFVGDGQLVGSATGDTLPACVGDCSTLVEIDPVSGAATLIGIIGDDDNTGECATVSDLTFDPTTRTLYGLGIDCEGAVNSKLLSIDPDTGAGTIVGSNTGVLAQGGGLAREPSSGTFFMTSDNDLYTVSPATGIASLVGAGDGTTTGTVSSLAFHPLTGVLFGSNDRIFPDAFLVTINTATGADTDVGDSQDELTALAFQGPAGCPDAPLGSCTGAQQASLKLTAKNGDLKLDLKKLGATATSAFGNPTPPTNTGYAVCLYDSNGGSPTLSRGYAVPGSGSWQADSKGFRFKNKTGNSDGITSVKLAAGETGKAKVSAKGKGVDLPTLPLPSASAVGQVINDLGSCFGATVTTTKENQNTAEKYTGSNKVTGTTTTTTTGPTTTSTTSTTGTTAVPTTSTTGTTAVPTTSTTGTTAVPTTSTTGTTAAPTTSTTGTTAAPTTSTTATTAAPTTSTTGTTAAPTTSTTATTAVPTTSTTATTAAPTTSTTTTSSTTTSSTLA